MLTALTKEQIVGLSEKPLPPVAVKTEFGEVYVPRLNAGGLTALLDRIEGKRKGVELSHLIVDQFGTRQFAEADAEMLERLPASFAVPVTRAFNRANGMSDPKGSANTADSPTG